MLNTLQPAPASATCMRCGGPKDDMGGKCSGGCDG